METLKFALFIAGLPAAYWLLVEVIDRMSRR
jgi:hypothetical protein